MLRTAVQYSKRTRHLLPGVMEIKIYYIKLFILKPFLDQTMFKEVNKLHRLYIFLQITHSPLSSYEKKWLSMDAIISSPDESSLREPKTFQTH